MCVGLSLSLSVCVWVCGSLCGCVLFAHTPMQRVVGSRSPERPIVGLARARGRPGGSFDGLLLYCIHIRSTGRARARSRRAARASASALSRTCPHNHVCHHPSLRARRQDRRRVHRQGHQRQVHDGLEAARQQVRIRRARCSTTQRERDWVWITPGVDDAITVRDRVLTVDASRARAR